MKIKKVGIIVKKDSADAEQIAQDLVSWFGSRAVSAEVDSITPDQDMLVILGGDGTLLHVAVSASEYQIPVVGVNLGGLGFLTEVAVNERYEVLEAILTSEINIEDRMMLKVRLCSKRSCSAWFYALNDVVVSKSSVDQLVRLGTWMNEEYITTYRADGLIFSTPTGSTAYNLSAGGPIVQPELRSILVTPICPFMLESRSVLLPSTCTLTTRLADKGNMKVIVDGRFAWDMNADDWLEVEASDKPLRLISSPKKGYFEILRSKLNWGGGEPRV